VRPPGKYERLILLDVRENGRPRTRRACQRLAQRREMSLPQVELHLAVAEREGTIDEGGLTREGRRRLNR
jgi:hypothetical protein